MRSAPSTQRNSWLCLIGFVGVVLFVPAHAHAQSASSGAIAGVVRDSTGSVLPGVTVEASSPALIEKVRAVDTDAQGQYKIIDLRPGTYTVTFRLEGFTTVRREGIEVSTGFTAVTDAELSLGSLAETVTVTGASPVVDTQNVRTQNVLSRDVLDSLPTGRTISAFATLTLGTNASSGATDLGGSFGERTLGFGVHGQIAADQRMNQSGMFFSNGQGSGNASSRQNQVNQMAVEELVLETSGMGAEAETGGVQINIVPKEGGNEFHGSFLGSGAASGLQADNLTDEVRALGVTETAGVKRVYDVGTGIGGPIARDRLWFFTAHRWWAGGEYVPGVYFNKTPGTLVYTKDPTRQGFSEHTDQDSQVRLTWQVAAKHKISGFASRQRNCQCYLFAANKSPEAAIHQRYKPLTAQGTWTFPFSNRLLIDAGITYAGAERHGERTEGATPTSIMVRESTTGFVWGANVASLEGTSDYTDPDLPTIHEQHNEKFTVSYVTGSHAFKTGVTFLGGNNQLPVALNEPPISYSLTNGVPRQITEYASPLLIRNRAFHMGAFVQDQWTLQRLTVNAGVRFDHARERALPIHSPAGMFKAARDFPEVRNVPNWKDVSPRLGAAYDLFGTGKTALKVSLARYVLGEIINVANRNNPGRQIARSATRTWDDVDFDLVPDCQLTNPLANGECGQISNLNLGEPVADVRDDPDLLTGWGVRQYNWQTLVSVQHELASGFAVTVGYFRTVHGDNVPVTDNLAVGPEDYDEYCITAPTDPRLGPSSGERMCGLYDVKPSKFGLSNNLNTLASKFGRKASVYNGVDASVNLRFGRGRWLAGGVSVGRMVDDQCFAVDFPERPGFCRVVQPWSAGTQVKLAGLYPLPWNMQVSGTFQNLANPPLAANLVVSNNEVAPSLGRNLAACQGRTPCNAQVTVPLIPTSAVGIFAASGQVAVGSLYGDRLTQLDLRLTKVIRLGRTRFEAMVDAYNVLNAISATSTNAAWGSTWLRPLTVLGGRLFKLGGQVTF